SANTVTYTIQNTGNLPLTIGAITFSGTNAADFTVITLPSSTISASSSTTFTVRFFPSTSGVKNATMTIVNDDSNENPYNFSIRGTGLDVGVAQEIQIEGNATIIPDNATLTSTNNWTILGDTFVNTPITRTYTIKNTGLTTLTIGAISFSGTNASEFTVTTAPSATVAGGSSTTFVVRFLPLAAGIRTAAISIVNNDATENPYNFAIRGNSFTSVPSPEIDLQGNYTSIANGDNTPSINDWTDFDSTQIITNPQTKTFTIQNYGGSNLNLTGAPLVSIIGSADFVVIATPSTPITSLNTTTFKIQFNPSSLGLKTAVVSIASNDSDENPYTFTIQGTGIQTFFDSDGDVVYDNIDIDDDNDGIKDLTEEVNCNNSNGTKVDYKFLYETFGTGVRTTINTTYAATTTYGYQDAVTPTNVEGSGLSLDLNDGKYTVGSSTQIASWANQYWYKGVDHTGNVNGRMAIFNASYTPGIFYTALITGALPNIPITYSFWVLNIDRTDAPSIGTRLRPNIRVEFRDINDNVLATINTGAIAPTTNGNLAGDWYQFTAPLTFNVTAFKVIFINNETGGTGNDLALDDILITQKLCDLDSDGIADLFDLDADNDGIEDVIEAGLGSISNARGKIDVAWADSNVNGLHDGAESAGALPALDSDGDTIPNYIDLDSDNDSLFDVDESGAGNTNAVTGFVNGDGDITGDGRGDGPESENFRSKDTNGDLVAEGFGDGILDIYDYGTGITFISQYGNLSQGIVNANPATTYLKDTDNDGIPDYLDTMSNGVSYDIANTLLIYDYKILDTNNDGIIDSATDTDKDGIADLFDTAVAPAYFGSPRDMNTKLFLDFDGRNDYGQSTAILGGLANASLMAWIDLNPTFATDGVIVGQDKFQIRVTSAKKLEAVLNGTTVTYNTALNVSQWYNVGATYDGSNLKLYLNGVLVGTQAVSGAITADASLLTLGRNPMASNKYFNGKIDEVRVFNSALTDSHLQRMVYQEIQNNGSEIRGLIVPKNVATTPASLPFTNLIRYYRMDAFKDDIIDDLTTPAIDVIGTKIFNHKNIRVQQAPMPFMTERTGDFATAVHNITKDIRGLDILDNDYSIVQVKHNITETSNSTDLAMFVDSGINIIMNNDTKLQNDWYLKLDGKIDLEGKSQLVQTTESDLDVTSSGSAERDQQGHSNLYNYNYWSAPVSPVNITSNNNDYNITSIMRDGTNPAIPANINWVAGYNGAPTSPISLAGYWIYKFDNYGNDYFNWVQLGQTGAVRVGLGYTMKGSGAIGTQNYVFNGKPNSGAIVSNVVGDDQLLLVGNPYASSLDATEFINDNSSSIDGTLYFWEHYASNNTHDLRDYQGGYAERNLTGGIAPVAPALISGLGSSTKVPGQFIPVGQGFFVNGKIGGGGIVEFNNSQRGFHKEDETGVSNSMFKKNPVKNPKKGNNENDKTKVDTNNYMKIRLGFTSHNNYHRQILLGFMNEKATDDLDYGYDGLNLDENPNDMYFLAGESQLLIQGVGAFYNNDSYPIGVKTDAEGKVIFMVDAIENFDKNNKIYIYDKVTKKYHDLKNQTFEIVLPKGDYNHRFALCFKHKKQDNDKISSVDDELIVTGDIKIEYTNSNHILNITNINQDNRVKAVTIYNILGQSISNWNLENKDQTKIQIPIKNISTGIYIAKLKTTEGFEISKKVVVFDD
uniref:choice-of-anchor D domain-containing protein n=1 Tax=Flavobacterium sp. TaxID=239 RepID=UPI00286B6B62